MTEMDANRPAAAAEVAPLAAEGRIPQVHLNKLPILQVYAALALLFFVLAGHHAGDPLRA